MTLYECLLNKLDILEKISKNTATQLRFLPRHEMRGLERLMREQAKYLQRLTMVNALISACSDAPANEEIDTLRQQIKDKEQEVLVYNEQALQRAQEERDNLAASLRRIRQYKHLRHGYRPQGGYAGGVRFNKKV